jgi:hypothetical protein
MKTVEIQIDLQVWHRLKLHARPLEDTPNTVLRRLLGIDDMPPEELAPSPRPVDPASPTSPAIRRANHGELLPESEYELPILDVLARSPNGASSARRVTQEVGERLRKRLSPLDFQKLPSGAGVRWENRVAFTRLRLVERGLLEKDSPRGIWEITDAGREHLRKSKRGA